MAEVKTLFLTGDYYGTPPFFFPIPLDLDPAGYNKVICIGGGGKGFHNGGGGGAAGHVAVVENIPLIPGEVVPFQLKSSSYQSPIDTWFKSPSLVMAKAGPDATGTSGAVSPPASASVGTIRRKGGNGGNGAGLDGSGNSRGAGAGGSAPTLTHDGYDGGDADPAGYAGGGGAGTGEVGGDGLGTTGGKGGKSANNTPGGAGATNIDGPDGVDGSGGGAPGSNGKDGGDGGAGTEFQAGPTPYGFGGGAAGSSGKSGSLGGLGGNAGDFGGAGGGSSYPTSIVGSSLGSRGLIIFIYTTSDVPPSPGESVAGRLRRAENVQPVHVLEIDAAIVGTEAVTVTPQLQYAHGIGSAPIDALSLMGFVTVERRTFVYSDNGYRAPLSDPDGAKISLPRLLNVPSFDRVLNLSLGQAAAGFSWGTGTIQRVDTDYDASEGGFLGINFYSTDGAPARMYLGLKSFDAERGIFVDPPASDLLPLFTGIAQQWQIGRDNIVTPLRDLMYLLDRPLQSLAYSGSGGLGGDASLSGTPLPKARGGTSAYPIRNVSPVLVDQLHLIYQYNDGPGTIEAIYEGAYAGFVYQGDVDDLYVGVTDSGKYRTNNANGLFQLGVNPTAAITCDVTGEFPGGGPIHSPAKIARYLLVEELGIGAASIDLTAFTLAEAQYDYVAGVYISPDAAMSGLQAVSFLLGSIGAKIGASKSGKLRPFVIRGYHSPADAIYTARDIDDMRTLALPDDVSPVVSRLRVRFGKNWTVQGSGYLGAATAAQKQFAASGGPVASWSDGMNLVKYPSAKDPEIIETALLVESEAQAVADALGGFWGVPRRAFQIDVPLYALERDIADNIRFDEDIGIRPYPFYCFVYGISYSPGSGICTLSVIA